jgi:hypothetical protein
MRNRNTRAQGFSITAADLLLHALATQDPGGDLYFTTPAANTGTVTIVDAAGVGGIVLGPGVGITIPVVMIRAFMDVQNLSYKFSHVGDILNFLVVG